MAAHAKTSVDKGKADSSINKRKMETTMKPSIDSNLKSDITDTKSEINPKTLGTLKRSSRTTATITNTTTRLKEKKVFALPGQKYDTPEEREPLRIFYESLSKQIPTSDMAQFWMMEHGLLSAEKAKRTQERKLRKQKELRTGTPIKSVKPPNKLERSSENGEIKAKKRIVDESEDEDDDFIASPKKKMIKSS